MKKETVDMFMLTNGKYFPNAQLVTLRSRLEALPEEALDGLMSLDLRDPDIMILVSAVLGTLGIDRFFIGQTALGVLKLITLGGCGIWAIIDWFLIRNATREENLNSLLALIRNYQYIAPRNDNSQSNSIEL